MIRLLTALLLLLPAGSLLAQEPGFTPPAAYPVQRYEAGWGKNPFTLKTAPVIMENAPFARDLAVGTYYGDTSDPTIVIVNTKTNERFRLKKGQPASNGMKLDKVQFGSGRKDIAATVTFGAETSEIRYNDSYLKQVASTEGGRAPAAGQQPGAQQQPLNRQQPVPQKTPMPQMPGQPGAPPPASDRASNAPALGGVSSFAASTTVPPALAQRGLSAPAIVTAGASGTPSAPSITVSTQPATASTGSGNLTVSVGAPPAAATTAPVLAAQQTAVAELPQRRRFVTPVLNATANP